MGIGTVGPELLPHVGLQDSVVVESPLPGGAATMVRFLLQSVPQWVQIGGAIAGILVGVALFVVVWRRRPALAHWINSRPRKIAIGLAASAAVLVLAGAAASAVSWNYMQHDNGFCTGCHIMGEAFERFTASEHDSLSCHDCHQQSIFASARQLYLWVAERPAEIGAHSPVPDRVCETCHVTNEPETWQHVASTAGHRTHLESDSVALDSIMCVTCHGAEVHRFRPVDQTCAQSACHVDNEITLGAMANQTALHCATCHEFTLAVPLLATTDSAAGTLVPNLAQCLSCHEMREVLGAFDPDRDPHSGTCGMCHNPHEQRTASDARTTCTTAGCHDTWRREPFHVGSSHRDAGQNCTTCHQPHTARVDASDCAGCHEAVAERPGVSPRVRDRLRRLRPFDTTEALRRTGESPPPLETDRLTSGRLHTPSADPALARRAGKGDARLNQERVSPPAVVDTFEHREHVSLSCLTCHETASGHGLLRFAAPRGCQICHHAAEPADDCATCHIADELALSLSGTVRIRTRDAPVRSRSVPFAHTEHIRVECRACHSVPVTLAATVSVVGCVDCHDDHHDAARTCASCHTSETASEAHAHGIDAHLACDACHAPATIARLVPDRPFCATCHQPQAADHYDATECSTCHMLTPPDQFRRQLRRLGSP